LDGLVFLAMGSSVHAGDGQQSRTALVRALDWRDGSLVWEHKICPPALGAICYHAGPPVGAPSLFLGQGNQVYVALHDELLSIELGSLKDTAVVRGSQGSPAATWDKVYLATAEGLRTFPFLLDRPPFSVVVDAGAPMTNDSSPSVGPDGTVYIVGDDGVLRAYAGPPN
jgi:hypothetical protein